MKKSSMVNRGLDFESLIENKCEELEEEQWRNIVGFEGKYTVSNLGRIKSLNYRNKNIERVLKLGLDKSTGYLKVSLSGKTKSVHRLVAQAFIPNYNNYEFVDHINTIRTDNRVKNLRWCTRSENMMNPITRQKNSLSKIEADNKGKNNPMYGVRKFDGDNPSSKKVICVTTNKIFNSLSQACRFYKINNIGNLTYCCQGVQKTCGKTSDGVRLQWMYYTDYLKILEGDDEVNG